MHVTDDELVAHYYGELDPAAERLAAAHLDACDVCRANLAKLKRVMAAIDMAEMPQPPAGFESQVWRRLQPAIATESVRATGRSWASSPAWRLGAWGSMAAGLLIAAFLVGRMFPNQGANSANGANGVNGATAANGANSAGAGTSGAGSETGSEPVRERVLLVDLGDHLDRTE